MSRQKHIVILYYLLVKKRVKAHPNKACAHTHGKMTLGYDTLFRSSVVVLKVQEAEREKLTS